MPLVSRIQPSTSLAPRLRALIEDAVERADGTIGEAELQYIAERIESKLMTLNMSATYWVRAELARVATALHLIMTDHLDGSLNLSEREIQAVGVALHYLVNPFDVIPDYVVAEGYLDDAVVMNWCLRKLERSRPALIKRYLRVATKRTGVL